jgi:hypothetical protein
MAEPKNFFFSNPVVLLIYGFFLGVKRPGPGAEHSPSGGEVKN